MKLVNDLIKAPKHNKIKFYTFAVIGLVTAIADLLITYIGSPGLEFEANPLITIFGLGWSALIIANIIVYAFFLIFIYIAFVRYKRTVIKCDNFKQFMSMLYFDRPDKYIWLWYKFPKGKIYRLFAPMGFAIAYTFPILRLIAISGWLMILSGTELCIFCHYGIPHVYIMHIEILILAILAVVLITSLVSFWYSKEYKINKRALDELNTPQSLEPEINQDIKPEVIQQIEPEVVKEIVPEVILNEDLEAKILAEYEAKIIAEYEAKIKPEYESRLKAELESKIRAEFEEQRKVEEETRLKAELEARQKAENEARQKAEFEAQQRAKLEAKQQAALEAKQKAELRAIQKAQQKENRKAQTEAKQKAKTEAKQNAELEARKKELEVLKSAGWSSSFNVTQDTEEK